MFGEARLFEDIAKTLLAPPAARLGRRAQRVDEVAGLVAHLSLPCPHQIDRLTQAGIMVDPLFLDRLELLLVGLEERFDGVDGLGELLPCLFKERLARLAEEL